MEWKNTIVDCGICIKLKRFISCCSGWRSETTICDGKGLCEFSWSDVTQSRAQTSEKSC